MRRGLWLSVVDAPDGDRPEGHRESRREWLVVEVRYTVARETPNILAMSVAAMPLSRRLRALAASAPSTLRGRPPLRPLAAAMYKSTLRRGWLRD
jgi:hypothetical protein